MNEMCREIGKLDPEDQEWLLNQVRAGKMTVDEANVKKILLMRVCLIMGKLPSSVRKSLNSAVKSGELEHMKKDGVKPEAYFSPGYGSHAIAERNRHELAALSALIKTTHCHSVNEEEN